MRTLDEWREYIADVFLAQDIIAIRSIRQMLDDWQADRNELLAEANDLGDAAAEYDNLLLSYLCMCEACKWYWRGKRHCSRDGCKRNSRLKDYYEKKGEQNDNG